MATAAATTATGLSAGATRVAAASSCVRRLRAALFTPVDGASLAVLRIALGTVLAVAVGRYFAHGWIHMLYVAPAMFFPWEGLAWIRPLPAPAMYALFAVLGLAALATAAGWRTRASAAVLGAGFTWIHLADKTNYLNHYYLVSLLCLLVACTASGAAFALDARRRPGAGTVPAWAIALLRFQLAVVYVFGGLAKLNPDWLLRAQPLRLWLAASVDVPIVGPLLERPATAWLFSFGGAAFDLGIVPLLLWRRTRPWAYALVVAFHVTTALLFPIGIFPWLMIALTPIFFAPSWPRTLAARLRGTRAPAGDESARTAAAPRTPTTHETAIVAALALYALVQVLVPLRGLLAPGNGYWTERGFRFAWKVMVMEKNGDARFRVRDVATGRVDEVDPRSVLTRQQNRMLATQPDLIAAFARALAAEAEGEGRAVEVRADVFASLNGRPSRRLIDPTVDLAHAAPDGDWVLPLE